MTKLAAKWRFGETVNKYYIILLYRTEEASYENDTYLRLPCT